MIKWILPLLLILAACGKTPAPTPRPAAYPRIDLYPAEYRSVEVLGHNVLVNTSASFSEGLQPGWFDIRYPAYGVTVQATLTEATGKALQEAIDNRNERMWRNVSGATAEAAEGSGMALIVAPTALRTPVQLLATDSLTYLLSAVAVTDWPAGTDPDSVAPIVSALAADLLRLKE